MEKSSNIKNNSSEWMTAAALVVANFFTACILLLLPLFGKKKESIERKDLLLLIIAGLLGVTLNQTFSIIGISATNPIHSSLLIMSTPIIVTVLAAILLKEDFGGNKIIGLLLGLSGAFLLIWTRASSSSAHPATLFGDCMIIAGSICYSTYLILIRKISKKYSPITILRFVFLFGALFSIPISLKSFVGADWNAFEGLDWFAIFYIVIPGTLGANLMMNWGVQQWGPSKTGTFVYFQPLFGTLGAIMLMGESFSLFKALAGMLIIGGVWISSLKRNG